MSLVEAGQRIHAHTLSPVELVESCVQRALEHETRLGAFITLDSKGAVAAARAAEREILRYGARGPLHGIPIAVKDMVATAGLPTTAGSRVLRDWVPERDAAVVGALRKAGAVIVGKTHTTEFAVWGTGGHPMYRLPRNPWDPRRVPGGSSTGSGIAVAAGFAPAAIGTDTGGSARLPASFCGVAGLKPTAGLLSTEGVIPLSWSYDHVGVMARETADVAAVLGAIRAPSAPAVTRPAPTDLAGVRLGKLELDARPAGDVESALSEADAVLAALGASVRPVTIPSAPSAQAISRTVQHAELLAYHEHGLRQRPEDYGPELTEGCRIGAVIGAAEYVRARRDGPGLAQEVDAALSGVDAIVAPTVGFTAPPIEAEEIDFDGGRRNVNAVISEYTRLYNITGHPALSLPCGFDSAGLPIGLQLIGRHGQDDDLLRIGAAYERATGWSTRRPALDPAQQMEV